MTLTVFIPLTPHIHHAYTTTRITTRPTNIDAPNRVTFIVPILPPIPQYWCSPRSRQPVDGDFCSTPEVMRHILSILQGMGVAITEESKFRLRCVRPLRRDLGASDRTTSSDDSTDSVSFFIPLELVTESPPPHTIQCLAGVGDPISRGGWCSAHTPRSSLPPPVHPPFICSVPFNMPFQNPHSRGGYREGHRMSHCGDPAFPSFACIGCAGHQGYFVR